MMPACAASGSFCLLFLQGGQQRFLGVVEFGLQLGALGFRGGFLRVEVFGFGLFRIEFKDTIHGVLDFARAQAVAVMPAGKLINDSLAVSTPPCRCETRVCL